MNRVQSTFAAPGGKEALISYITAGDSDRKTMLGLMYSLVVNGVDIIELGVPLPDPMAGGPTIQRAAERALVKGVSLNDTLNIVHTFRQTDRMTPMILMGHFNPAYKMGYTRFAEAVVEAGVDGIPIVDAPVENTGGLHGRLKSHGIDRIFLIAPITTEGRIRSIAAIAGEFAYYVPLKGITGVTSLDTDEISYKIKLLRKYISLPTGMGSDINSVESAHKIGKVADAVIVGSRIVKEIENNMGREAEVVGALIKELKDAVKAI